MENLSPAEVDALHAKPRASFSDLDSGTPGAPDSVPESDMPAHQLPAHAAVGAERVPARPGQSSAHEHTPGHWAAAGMPSQWQLGARTSLLFEAEHLYDIRPIDRGLVAVGTGVANIPVSRFLGDPNMHNRYNQGKATLILRHEFSEAWAWRSAFRTAVASEDYNSIEPSFLDADNQTFFLAGFRIPQLVQSHYLQNEVIGKFHTGPIGHRSLSGIKLGRETHNIGVGQT